MAGSSLYCQLCRTVLLYCFSAAQVELRWEPRDLWLLALNIISESQSYCDILRAIDPSAGPGHWPKEEEQRKQLLEPLWGAQMEAGNKISTAGFVQRRTADGKGRLFPRTLIQLLAGAIDYQKTSDPRSDRVLRSASVQEGYRRASATRVTDLKKEYDIYKNYLEGLRGMSPTGTETDIQKYLQSQLPKGKQRGAKRGSIHAGPGGWKNVIERLLEIGVLKKYKRARGNDSSLKYEVALLYRPGLGIIAYGV